ncbi:MAG: queuosine precursor transporter [Proteobacteria bacterium]|nr:queuosine precursor transporter [Pseudomonadota bacterium]
MLNILLFLGSCLFVTGFSLYFCRLGQNALTAWIATLSLLANSFVLKQIELFNLNATAADIFVVGSLLGLNLLQEKYGRLAAQQAMWSSFGCLLFFALASQIHLIYQPSIYDQTQSAYHLLLNSAVRIIIASLITFLIVDQLDIRLYAFLRKNFPAVSITLISALTICLSQLVDTLLFGFLGLYGIVQALGEIIIISYIIKLLAIANTVPWTRKIFSK